ncbi:hypothetical protein EVAR_19507_1 [Eumeta japonica]|uniref:Uncharacterized protein n=1 Tax=Eumeta variegata TaxID=151549 RepID=A0A4C1V9B2_EUMVA|nr:hypothetical protein EVAR_19507_1 [Eumeta japonica]
MRRSNKRLRINHAGFHRKRLDCATRAPAGARAPPPPYRNSHEPPAAATALRRRARSSARRLRAGFVKQALAETNKPAGVRRAAGGGRRVRSSNIKYKVVTERNPVNEARGKSIPITPDPLGRTCVQIRPVRNARARAGRASAPPSDDSKPSVGRLEIEIVQPESSVASVSFRTDGGSI